jgi:O-antigen/teichoic acid export membrane protein
MISQIQKLFPDKSIKRDTLHIYVFQGLTLGMGMVGGILVARTLGPSDKGVIDLFSLLSSFIVDFGMLGFGSGLLYYLANKRKPLDEIHGTGVVFAIVAGMLTVVLGCFGLSIWRGIFPGLRDWIILLAFLLAPLKYYGLIWSNIMTGINQVVKPYRLGIYFVVASVGAILGLWFFGRLNVENVIVLMVVLAVLNTFVNFGILFNKEPKLSLNKVLLRNCLRYGIVIYVGVVANSLHFRIDQIMINYWLGTEAVGIYAVSVRWAEMLFMLDSALFSASLYKICSSNAEESYSLSKRLFELQLVISSIAGALLALLAYPLVFLLYGKAYEDAALPLILLVPGIVAWSAGKVVSNMLTYNKKMGSFVTGVAISGSLLNICFNYLFLKVLNIGINGASLASSLSYTIVVFLILFKAKKVSTRRCI